jgi:3-hydroxybutyryl-CoA dehydrogenase
MAKKARIGIIGAGLMGHGIAQVFAMAGHKVVVHDPIPEALMAVKERIAANLKTLKLDKDALKRVKTAATLAEAAADADVVIEAAPEKPELKQAIFAELEKVAPRHAILASNTSVIPIGTIMAKVKTRDRALGTHWFNPPFLVPLVEVIETAGTSAKSVETMMALLALVQNGVCDAETVDTVVKASFGRRLPVIGPLENADLVGTDLTLDIHKVIIADLDRTEGPQPYLEDLVASGKLGFKTGEGFRKWTKAEQETLRKTLVKHLRKMAAELDG